MNIVKVHRAFAPKDFKAGQFVIEIEQIGDEVVVLCVQQVRSDGFLDLVEFNPDMRKRNLRAEECEPFYGTILIESKP